MLILLLKIIVNVFIVGLFLYSKLLPYKDKLIGQNQKIFNFFNSVFQPVLNGLKSLFQPRQVGHGISVDMTQIVLLVLLLIINNFI